MVTLEILFDQAFFTAGWSSILMDPSRVVVPDWLGEASAFSFTALLFLGQREQRTPRTVCGAVGEGGGGEYPIYLLLTVLEAMVSATMGLNAVNFMAGCDLKAPGVLLGGIAGKRLDVNLFGLWS